MKELLTIQAKLNAPKGQYNNFGKYKYRSCEDILAAVKPLLAETKCVLLLSDEVKEIGSPYTFNTQENDGRGKTATSSYNGSRFYVEATATLINAEGVKISVKGVAREEVVKKGMDASQVTGAASSYARKYALNGLFAIDDTKDADATNTHGQEAKPSQNPEDMTDAEKIEWYVKPAVAQATTEIELVAIWNTYSALQTNADFVALLSERKKAIKL